jgi:hypothetical protein
VIANFDKLRDVFARAVQAMPTHADFIAGYAPAPRLRVPVDA